MHRLLILSLLAMVVSCTSVDKHLPDSFIAQWVADMVTLQRTQGDDFERYLSRDDATFRDTSYNNAVVNLAFNVACWQGKSSTSVKSVIAIAAKYTRYGCHCGLGGSGRTVDKIDVCCRIHDICLVKASKKYKNKVWNLSLALDTLYRVTCTHRRSYCEASGMARAICECDRTVGYCFNKYRNSWRWWHALFFARRNC